MPLRAYVPDAESHERMGLGRRLAGLDGIAVRLGGPAIAASEQETVAAIGDAEVICTALRPVTARVIAAAPELRLIVKTGIGTDNIALDAARARGIPVVRTAGVNFAGVAEYAIAGMLAFQRRFRDFDRAVRDGRWAETRAEWSGRIETLGGRTLGIAGLGAVGREVARLGLAHGMAVIAHDPYVTAADARRCGVLPVDKAELLRDADILSLNLLLTDETRHYIGEPELAAMKPGALLVNSSRGPVVDEAALARALQARALGGAVLDVFELEPLAAGSPLLALDNCLLTPHLAGCTRAGYEEIGTKAAELVAAFAHGEELPAACRVA